MLKIQGLKKKFGNFEALSGLDMEVEEGALYGFVGPNGAGKTTAIRIITGLLKADEGTVMIGGKDAFLYSWQVKNEFGYVPDEFGLYDNLKVWEYMDFFASCYGLSGLVARERCTKLLEQVKLAGKEEFFVDSLSRGMKQRLCLARAMIHDPKLLVLDEPTSGMDPRARIEFKELLKELCAEGKTIVVSSHILSELAQMCTDIGIIDAGKVVLSGNMGEILKKVNDSNPIRIQVVENVWEAVKFLRTEPEVQTITVEGTSSTLDSLYEKAKDELKKYGGSGFSGSLQINAADLADIGVDTDRLDFLKETYVLSEPHGIENWLPCTKEVIPLHELDEKDFTFGETTSKLSSLQAANFGTAGKAWNAIQSTIGYLNTK